MNEFTVSLLFGGGVLGFFAWDQFKRPSYEESVGLTRLIEFLAPPDLRNGRVYVKAYVAYASILLMVYVVLCVFATVPILQALGFVVPDSTAPSTIPIALSLIMVGVAPGFPLLRDFEARIRFAAHHLSGIPARLLHGCRMLQMRPLGLPENGSGLLIPEKDWARLRLYRQRAPDILDDPVDFIDDMSKIFAFRAWILRHRVNLLPRLPRPGITRKEEGIRERTERLVLGLDTLTGNGHGTAANFKESWEKLAAEADQLCADVCALLMLYIEHGLIGGQREGIRPTDPEAAQLPLAAAHLEAFMRDADRFAEEGSIVGKLWTRTTIVAVAIAFLWGAALSHLDARDQAPQLTAIVGGSSYALFALLTYSLAIFVGLSLHERDTRHAGWPNMFQTHWVVWSVPAIRVGLGAALASLVCLASYNLYWHVAFSGLDMFLDRFWEAALDAILIQSPNAVIGALLALGTIASIDAWRTDEAVTRRYRTILVATAAAMILAGAASRGLAIQYGEFRCDVANPACTGLVTPLLTLMIDDQRLLFAGLRAGLIGTVALLVAQATLTHGLARVGLEGAGSRGARDASGASAAAKA